MKARYLLLAVFSFSVSCATVREVKTRPGKGGEIAVSNGMFGESGDEKASKIMKSNCRRGYRVVEKGEEVIGSTTTHSSTTKNKATGGKKEKESGFMKALAAVDTSDSQSDTQGSSDTTNKTEFRVKYECKKKNEPVNDDD